MNILLQLLNVNIPRVRYIRATKRDQLTLGGIAVLTCLPAHKLPNGRSYQYIRTAYL